MADLPVLPAYAQFVTDGYGEEFDPSVERTEMERGVAKERIINTDVIVELSGTLMFFSAAKQQAFMDWYFDTLGRIGWFTMTDPRTGSTLTARFKSGALGKLSQVASGWRASSRDVTLEYLR